MLLMYLPFVLYITDAGHTVGQIWRNSPHV